MGRTFPNRKLGPEVWQRVPADTQMDVQHDRCVAKMPAMPDVLMFLEVTSQNVLSCDCTGMARKYGDRRGSRRLLQGSIPTRPGRKRGTTR